MFSDEGMGFVAFYSFISIVIQRFCHPIRCQKRGCRLPAASLVSIPRRRNAVCQTPGFRLIATSTIPPASRTIKTAKAMTHPVGTAPFAAGGVTGVVGLFDPVLAR